jgi:ABC-type multidrug transport system permease subunit
MSRLSRLVRAGRLGRAGRARFGPVRWLLLKDLAILRRSPLLVGILVIYPVALALMIGLALSSPPGRPRVAVYSGVPAGKGTIIVGGSRVDIGAYTRQLSSSITRIPVRSAAAAVAAVRSGRAQAAIIVPAGIISQVQALISQGVGTPTVQLVLNDASPLEREVVDAEIQTRIDQVQTAISKQLLSTALGDLRTVVNGGELNFGGASVSLLGLKNARTVVAGAIPLVKGAGLGTSLAPALEQVVNFADIASQGLSFASPVLGQIQSPLTVDRRELSDVSAPTSTYAVAIAVTVSELFLALLLAAALLALERSEQVYARLVRGPVSAGGLLAEKVLIGALAAAVVALVMSAVVSIFVGLDWGGCELWVLALGVAGLAFAALGVALGALAREVAAAALLVILVGLPVAFLALIPATAVSGGLAHVLSVISFIFPFKAGLGAVSSALTGAAPGLGWPLVHLVALALAYGLAGRLALVRFGD